MYVLHTEGSPSHCDLAAGATPATFTVATTEAEEALGGALREMYVRGQCKVPANSLGDLSDIDKRLRSADEIL